MCFFEYVISNTQKKKNKREARWRKSEKTENRWEREYKSTRQGYSFSLRDWNSILI